MIIAGTIKNSVNRAAMESKWEQKKQNLNKRSGDMTAEERILQSFQEQIDSIRENRKPNEIDAKLQAGGKLTPEEIEYLKRNNPQALKEYEEIQRERESYRKQLKRCKSKEEVEKLKMTKMGQYLSATKKIMNDPHISKAQKLQMLKKIIKETSAIEKEQVKFLQSSKYATLPDDEKEAKKKGRTDAESGQDEKTDATTSDMSEIVTKQDPEAENADQIGGNIDLKL